MKKKHITIVGGGIAGCMTAMELVKRGCRVTVVERNQIASQTSGESSWAGAGLAFPLLPWMYRDEVNQLALAGANLYQSVSAQLLQETGIDPEYMQSGMLIKPPFDETVATQWCMRNHVPFEKTGDDLLLPQVAQIRNPRLLQALKQWLLSHKVTLLENTQLLPIANTTTLNQWKTTRGETLEADLFIVTSGAWSYELLKETAVNLTIKPMRGQILLYQIPVNTLPHIVYQDGFYLLQRRDGYLLAGSTLEDVGFDTSVTEAAKLEMQAKAEAILPALKGMSIHKHWSGLRPGTPENLPTISQHPTIANLYLNTGHFRYGVTMAPASAKLICDLIFGEKPEIDPTPYRCLS
ncbi:MAG: FAD-dependent oxidoreductase [Betaproteobacteria bacterium HGW-Betaproteobacteria-22]|nr:MAG: FAD-dependent oxidoreductase [Betaproteobacteria bacterium HGW-Betaproteobacteria-22]